MKRGSVRKNMIKGVGHKKNRQKGVYEIYKRYDSINERTLKYLKTVLK